jgi:hypothetical protein
LILLVVLHGCDSLSHYGKNIDFACSESRVPRRICGAKEEEVDGTLEKITQQELHNSYSSPNIIMEINQ